MPIFIALLIVALCSGAIFYIYQRQIEQIITHEKTNTPYDYTIQQGQIEEYDKNGKLIYVIQSKQSTHFPQKNTIELFYPQLTDFKNAKSPLVMTAVKGKIITNKHQLILWNKVLIKQFKNKKVISQLLTPYLVIDKNKSLATTDSNVLFTSENVKLSAKGLDFYYDQSYLKLNSKVKGVYANH